MRFSIIAMMMMALWLAHPAIGQAQNNKAQNNKVQDKTPAPMQKPASAEDSAVNVHITLNDEMRKAEHKYQQIRNILPDEEKEYLADLEKEFLKALDSDAKIRQTKIYLKACMTFDDDVAGASDKYADAYYAWEKAMEEKRGEKWQDYNVMAKKADFIDRDVLNRHLNVRKYTIYIALDSMMEQRINEGNVDCGTVKQTLSSYL